MFSRLSTIFFNLSRKALIPALVICFPCASGCGKLAGSSSEVSRTLPLMGTFVTVKAVHGPEEAEKVSRSLAEVFSLASQLEDKLSMYVPSSELNELNTRKRIKVSEDLEEVISLAIDISRVTSGAFDPTVAPILKRNGFYGNMPPEILSRIPENDEAVGFRNVRLDKDRGEIFLENSAWLDLSGIAKGYIVDRMAAYLNDAGIESFIINAGGDIYCGRSPRGSIWRVGIRRPGSGEIWRVLELESCAVATSGDYENFLVDGKTSRVMSHIADTSELEMTDQVLTGMTVIAENCALADALATGITARGIEKASETAGLIPGVEVIAVSNKDGEWTVFMTPGAKRYLSGEGSR